MRKTTEGKLIYLVGFMGSGKTTVGRETANALSIPCFDLDSMLEERLGMPVTEVFRQKGERFFRHEESSLLRNIPALLPEGSSAVVSCGGGIVLEPENRDLLRSTGTVFLLEVSPESVLERTAADNSRPLLIGRSPDEIRGMMAERGALYAEVSDHTIRTDGKTPPEIASEIISLL